MLSLEQQAVVDCEIEDILVVEAYAGCGKTSTLINFCEKRKKFKILYLAYNKSMANEAKIKFAHLKNVSVMTMHSLAYKAFGIKNKERLKNNNKIEAVDIIRLSNFKNCNEALKNKYALEILKYSKDFLNSGLTIKEFLSQIDISKTIVSFGFLETNLCELWERVLSDKDFPYEHDYYLKEYQLSNPILDYDYILVDEAQDLNACVIDIVLRQASKKVFIGDTYQSIYSFRGANNALRYLSSLKQSKTIYLTSSYRCSSNIAELANKYLKLAGSKQDFIGLNTKIEDKYKLTYITRTNAKLFDLAVEFATEGKKIFIVGGIESCKFDLLIDIFFLLINKKDKIKNSFFNNFIDFGDYKQYVEDIKDVEAKTCILIVFKYIRQNLFNLKELISSLCVQTEQEADIILTTAHKSKGLEWYACVLSDDFLAVKKAIIDYEKKIIDSTFDIKMEELNLFYVAITRAKQVIFLDEKYCLSEQDVEILTEHIDDTFIK